MVSFHKIYIVLKKIVGVVGYLHLHVEMAIIPDNNPILKYIIIYLLTVCGDAVILHLGIVVIIMLIATLTMRRISQV